MATLRLLPELLSEVFTDPRKAAKRAGSRILRGIVRDIVEGRWKTATLVALFHAITSYAGLVLLGETDLIVSATRFVYFYVITGSTVGYGDFSPSTELGRLFVSLYVVPGAITIFALIVTKLLASLAIIVRKFMSGFGNFENTTDHFVIIGYVAGQTENLIEETKAAHNGCETVLVTIKDNLPLPDRIARVRTNSLSSTEDLIRAGIKGAKSVVIMADNDDETMAAALAISAMGTNAHVVAYFREKAKAKLIRPHCPDFEFVVSTSVQQVSRAIVDPGASEVLGQLSSTNNGPTLHSMDYSGRDTTVGEMRAILEQADANLFGLRLDHEKEPTIVLTSDMRIGEEHTIFYVSAKRLPDDFQLAA